MAAKRLRLAAVAAVVALAGCGGGGDAREPDSASGARPFARGEAVWAEHGCGGCHTFGATRGRGGIGPDLDEALRGKSAAEIRRDIVDPAAAGDAGYYCANCVGGMPRDFAKRIPPDDLDALVEMLESGAR